jgi:hypothetical protein
MKPRSPKRGETSAPGNHNHPWPNQTTTASTTALQKKLMGLCDRKPHKECATEHSLRARCHQGRCAADCFDCSVLGRGCVGGLECAIDGLELENLRRQFGRCCSRYVQRRSWLDRSGGVAKRVRHRHCRIWRNTFACSRADRRIGSAANRQNRRRACATANANIAQRLVNQSAHVLLVWVVANVVLPVAARHATVDVRRGLARRTALSSA